MPASSRPSGHPRPRCSAHPPTEGLFRCLGCYERPATEDAASAGFRPLRVGRFGVPCRWKVAGVNRPTRPASGRLGKGGRIVTTIVTPGGGPARGAAGPGIPEPVPGPDVPGPGPAPDTPGQGPGPDIPDPPPGPDLPPPVPGRARSRPRPRPRPATLISIRTVQRVRRRGSGNRAFDPGAAPGRMDRAAAEGGALCGASTDEPGYPCIARRWTGSDDAKRRPGGASRTVLLPEPRSQADQNRPAGRPVSVDRSATTRS